MNYLLSEAQGPIFAALERLVAKDEELHPFVVVDRVGQPDVFVQFATRNGVLYFDVPKLEIKLEPVTPEEGSLRAVLTMIFHFDVGPNDRVLVHEEEDGGGMGRGEPFWKQVFSFCGFG